MIDKLQKIGFTKIEAQIYIELLKSKGLTGYQIAKNLNVSRSTVYPALDVMYKKGYIMLLQGEAQTYIAEEPDVLLKRLNEEFVDNTKNLKTELKGIKVDNQEEKFISVSGFDQTITKVKELLASAKEEVIMNIDGGIQYFKDDIIKLRKRGVRVIIFSFAEFDTEDLDIEFYTHRLMKRMEISRIMVVVDFKYTLVADTNEERPNWFGVLTNNPLMTSVICEHIHHDIYILLYQQESKIENPSANKKLNTLSEKASKFNKKKSRS